jgi:hypothetical protein
MADSPDAGNKDHSHRPKSRDLLCVVPSSAGHHFGCEPERPGCLVDEVGKIFLKTILPLRAGALVYTTNVSPGGGGHDAQEIARLGPLGMIFIPSIGGISHSPKEFSRPQDVENGANVLLQTVLAFDKK